MQAARFSHSRLWLALSAMGFLFALPAVGFAQDYPPPQYPDRPYVSSSQDLAQLSRQLESLAMRARDEAKMDSRNHGSDELAEKIDDFAKDARQLRLYANERGVPAAKINDRIRKLIDDARDVQKESVKAKRHNPQTDADWNRTVALLDRINDRFLAANGVAAGPVGTRGYYPNGRPSGDRWTDNRATMLNDLDRRADDAARLAESANLDVAPQIDRLRDQVRSFRQSSDELSITDTRANVSHLLADARAVQADLAGSNAPPRLRDDVSAMVGTLVQMRDMTGETVGTSGYGTAPGVAPERDRDRDRDADIARDRYEAMDAAELSNALNMRLARAADLAAQRDQGDIGEDIAHFRDKLADFQNNSATMSSENRREAAGRLLQDAQKLQREMADHRVSTELMDQWNTVVDLVARLRDAS